MEYEEYTITGASLTVPEKQPVTGQVSLGRRQR